jgi:hypothetical protein
LIEEELGVSVLVVIGMVVVGGPMVERVGVVGCD